MKRTAFDVARYDTVTLRHAYTPWADFLERLRPLPEHERVAMLRARFRWRVDEFAEHVMREILSRTGSVAPPNDLDEALLGPAPYRWSARPGAIQLVAMTGRGVGKTTRQRIRSFHGQLYGLRSIVAVIAHTDDEARESMNTIVSWAREPSELLAKLFPELALVGNAKARGIRTRFGESRMLCRGIDGAIRGMNHRGRRPDSVDLDDIEGETNTLTPDARKKMRDLINDAILNLVPNGIRPEVTWCQTPMGGDTASGRIMRGDASMPGWDLRKLPVLTRWPTNEALVEEMRAIFFDADAEPNRPVREALARAFYARNKTAIDEGAEVLDPVNMGVCDCLIKLWSIGRSAFEREYLMVSASGGNTFTTATWRRHRVSTSGAIHYPDGTTGHLYGCPMWAHFDSSDGGDPAALVVSALVQGRVMEVATMYWEGTPLSQQIADIPGVIRPWVAHGLRVLHWEPPPGAASVVERDILAALHKAGVLVQLVEMPSSDNKTARIANTLEPLAAGGLLTVREDVDPRALETADAFRVDSQNNVDDWLDALQRCAEGLTQPSEPTLQEFLDGFM